MKVSASMESLWQYIQSLSLSERNREWLAERLLEGTKKENAKDAISKEEILAGIDRGLKDMKAGRSKPFDEFMKEWDSELQD